MTGPAARRVLRSSGRPTRGPERSTRERLGRRLEPAPTQPAPPKTGRRSVAPSVPARVRPARAPGRPIRHPAWRAPELPMVRPARRPTMARPAGSTTARQERPRREEAESTKEKELPNPRQGRARGPRRERTGRANPTLGRLAPPERWSPSSGRAQAAAIREQDPPPEPRRGALPTRVTAPQARPTLARSRGARPPRATRAIPTRPGVRVWAPGCPTPTTRGAARPWSAVLQTAARAPAASTSPRLRRSGWMGRQGAPAGLLSSSCGGGASSGTAPRRRGRPAPGQ